ncbi:MAG: sulfotransferase [Cyanobacteria bacterium P01_F01_bin.56]
MALNQIADKTLRQIYQKSQSVFWPRYRQDLINDCDIKEVFSTFRSPCVFVLSTGRTGTQTLASLLSLSSTSFVYHEPIPLLYGLSNMAYKHNNCHHDALAVAEELFEEAFLTARRSLLHYSIQFRKGYIETSPQVTFLAPIIGKVIPQAKFIQLVRDPRYVIRSGMRRKWYAGHSADDTRIVPDPATEVGRNWGAYSLFEKNAWLWTETNRKIEEFLKTVPNHQKLFVNSENIFNNNQRSIKNIFDFVGSSTPSKSKVKRVLMKKINRQMSGEFTQVNEWETSMILTLKTMAGDLAMRYGYSLEGVDKVI